MNPLRILILEDDDEVAEQLKNILVKHGNYVAFSFKGLDEALRAVRSEIFDLALINMQLQNEESGVILAKEINRRSLMPFLFLISEEEKENFEPAGHTKPSAYLLKPILERELLFQLRLALKAYQSLHTSHSDINTVMFLPTHKGLKKIDKRDVALLEANKSSTYIYLKNLALPELFSVNLGYLSQFFKVPDFYMVSRSAVINLNYIEEIEFNEIKLTNISRKIRISENKKNGFLKSLFIVRRPK